MSRIIGSTAFGSAVAGSRRTEVPGVGAQGARLARSIGWAGTSEVRLATRGTGGESVRFAIGRDGGPDGKPPGGGFKGV